MKKTFLVAMAIVLVSGLILSGCAESDSSPAPAPTPAPPPEQTPLPPEPETVPAPAPDTEPTPTEPETVTFPDRNLEEADASNRFSELLKLIPATLDVSGYFIFVVDYASFRQDNDISFSTQEDYVHTMTEDEVGSQLVEMGAYITGNSPDYDRTIIQDKYVGYNVTDVDAEIQANSPPHNIVAAIGRYDPRATKDALSNRDEWPSWAKESYATEDYRGITIHSWGDGYITHLVSRLSPPHLDNLGRARLFSVSEQYLFSAGNVSDVKSMIDASQNKHASLADVPELALAANGMSDLDAYAAILGYAEILRYEFFSDDPEPRLKKFTTFGSGQGRDEKGIYMAIVLVHESPDDAEENVSLLEQRIESTVSRVYDTPWKQWILDKVIHVEGKVLLAKLYISASGFHKVWDYSASGFWLEWVLTGDRLLLYEN